MKPFLIFAALILNPVAPSTYAEDTIPQPPQTVARPSRVLVLQCVPERLLKIADLWKQQQKKRKVAGLPEWDHDSTVLAIAEELISNDEFHVNLNQTLRYELWHDGNTTFFAGTMPIHREEAGKLMTAGGTTLSPVDGFPDLYEMKETRNVKSGKETREETYVSGYLKLLESSALFVQLGYTPNSTAKISAMTANDILRRIEKDARRKSKYDFFVSSQPNSVQPDKRRILIEQLRRIASPALQQRDKEGDASFYARRFFAQTALDVGISFLSDCTDFEIGFLADATGKEHSVEFNIKAKDGSDLDRWLKSSSRIRSPFSSMLQAEGLTRGALSLKLGDEQRKLLAKLADATADLAVEAGLSAGVAREFSKSVGKALKPGALHFYLSLENPADPFDGFSGGIALRCGDALPAFVDEFVNKFGTLTQAQPGVPENGLPAMHVAPFVFEGNKRMALSANAHGLWFAVANDGENAKAVLESLLIDLDASRQQSGKASMIAASLPAASGDLVLEVFAAVVEGFDDVVSTVTSPAVSENVQVASTPQDVQQVTYSVDVQKADGTVVQETRVANVAGENVQIPAQPAKEQPSKAAPQRGVITVTTQAIDNGLRIRTTFSEDGFLHFMIAPDMVMAVLEMVMDQIQ